MTRTEIIDAIHKAVNQAVMEFGTTEIRKRIKAILKKTCPEAKVVSPKRNYPYCASAGPMITNFPECDSSVSEVNWALPLAKILFPSKGTK